MDFVSYEIDYGEIRDSDIDSILSLLSRKSSGEELLNFDTYEPRNEVEEIIECMQSFGIAEEPFKYDFDEEGNIYTFSYNSEFVIVGNDGLIEEKIPIIRSFGVKSSLE